MKPALVLVGGVILLAAVVIGIAAASFGTRWIAAPFRGTVEQREITNSGAFRIQAYQKFYSWHEESAALKFKLAHYAHRDLDQREQTECRALRGQHADIVSKYNSASRAEQTQGQWRAADLPVDLTNEGVPQCP